MITLLTREDKKQLVPLPCQVQLAGREEGAPLSMENRHGEVVSCRGGRGVKRQHAWEAPPRSHSTQPRLSSLASGACSSLVLL